MCQSHVMHTAYNALTGALLMIDDKADMYAGDLHGQGFT